MRKKGEKEQRATEHATILNKKRTYEFDRRQQTRVPGIKEMENANVAEHQTDHDHTQIVGDIEVSKSRLYNYANPATWENHGT